MRDAGDLVVTIRIRFGRDGVVQSAEIFDANYAEDQIFFPPHGEKRPPAVLKSSLIKELRRYGDYYNEWRDVTIKIHPPV